ncbi:glycine cleavage system protein R [Motiliproteus coralliicola]|uniref:Glycine cleavage system transcriptional repressor n=1 Tax=Motiliproteus coralliicola TaxID=2283196 RepID=A0A369WSP3_9GAMM|nr:ACT domain-containing protein [Motiliproteus coralliicola]RDE24591.1 glycine cleavage system protein R [Motiliproteus coralliicola]
MKTTLVISLIGEDRPGLVELLSQRVLELRGHWLASQFCRLQGQFAGTLQVRVAKEHSMALKQGLQQLQSQGLQVMVADAKPTRQVPNYGLQLRFVGPDRCGVIAEISEALRSLGVSINSLDSHCEPAPMSNESIFHACFDTLVPVSVSCDQLSHALAELAPELLLDLESVEADVS